MQRELLSDISHEFRAPLTTLQGFLELMREGKIAEEEYPRYIEIMHWDATHLSRLVQDLLDLDNMERNHSVLEKASCDSATLLNASAQHLQLKATEKNVRIEIKIDSDAPDVYVDRNRFHQVVINLVENALRYSPVGESVTLQAVAHGTGTLFQVTDRGTGIPEDELPCIWNRFYKVDKARTRQNTGSGLGLSIVRRIVELHGGWVNVENTATRGATFSFWFDSINQ